MFLFLSFLIVVFTVWDLLKASYMCTYNVPPFIKPSHLIFKWLCKDTAIFSTVQWNARCRVSQSFVALCFTLLLVALLTLLNGRFSRRSRRFTQTNNKTAITSPNCLSLRDNAACCILSASSALSAGEYTSKLTQSILYTQTPMSPADLADLRRRNPKPHKLQTVFLCVIMQLAAFLSASSALSAGEYSHESTLSILLKWNPRSLPQISLIYADKPQNNKTALTSN